MIFQLKIGKKTLVKYNTYERVWLVVNICTNMERENKILFRDWPNRILNRYKEYTK